MLHANLGAARDAVLRHVSGASVAVARPRWVRHADMDHLNPDPVTAASEMPAEPQDEELIARVLAGNTDAYALIVARYRERGARYAMRMLGNREDAEEALQDTFVRAFRALGRCKDPQHFDRWLFRILLNRCRSAGARWSRYRRRFSDTPAAEPEQKATDDGLAWRDAIGRALAQLDPRVREAFLLKHVEDLSYEEMATLTGVRVSALKMRVKRACVQLRMRLEEAPHHE